MLHVSRTLAILRLQTNDLGLEPKRRRVDLRGVTPKQELALAGVKGNDERRIERDADRAGDEHSAELH